MTCEPDTNTFVDDIKDGAKGILDSAAGGMGLAGLIAKETKAHIDGQTYDASLKDYYEAINGPQLARMAKLGQAVNAGKVVSGSYKYLKDGLKPATDATVDEIKKKIDEHRRTPDCKEDDPKDPRNPNNRGSLFFSRAVFSG
jgi:hypothetical protein